MPAKKKKEKKLALIVNSFSLSESNHFRSPRVVRRWPMRPELKLNLRWEPALRWESRVGSSMEKKVSLIIIMSWKDLLCKKLRRRDRIIRDGFRLIWLDPNLFGEKEPQGCALLFFSLRYIDGRMQTILNGYPREMFERRGRGAPLFLAQITPAEFSRRRCRQKVGSREKGRPRGLVITAAGEKRNKQLPFPSSSSLVWCALRDARWIYIKCK